jgi:hypothetical protein
MASLDSLPPDQRAVLQLVLQRGRSYDDIAAMLSIDRAAVRQRALDAFDALGPANSISAPQRALLTDYLLGQLPTRVAEQVHERLGASPPDRAWARMIASELGALAVDPLPEIPVGSTRRPPEEPVVAGVVPDPSAGAEYQQYEDERMPMAAKIRPDFGLDEPGAPVTSRRGGAILLALVGLVVVVVVVIVVATSGSTPKPKPSASTTPASSTGTATTPASTTGTTTTGSKAKLLTQVNLVPADPSVKNRAGVAQVIQSGATIGVVVVAQGVPANTTHNAYAIWLYNSPTDAKLLGFVNQRVKADGKLQTEGALPPNASHYKQMLLTVETHGSPKTPGTIVLEGQPSTGAF